MTNEIGKQLTITRKAHGLSREGLGRLSGYTAHKIARFEQGKDDITVAFVNKLAEALNSHTDFQQQQHKRLLGMATISGGREESVSRVSGAVGE